MFLGSVPIEILSYAHLQAYNGALHIATHSYRNLYYKWLNIHTYIHTYIHISAYTAVRHLYGDYVDSIENETERTHTHTHTSQQVDIFRIKPASIESAMVWGR